MTKPPGVPDEDVKAMKPSFKSRYGDNWKKVMYATLWKRHNKTDEELTRDQKINFIWENAHESRKSMVEDQRCISLQIPGGQGHYSLEQMSDDLLDHHFTNVCRALGEDAVDDQLKRHGFSRALLNSKKTVQSQQFQGRPQAVQHAAKNGPREAWDTKYETPDSKKGMFKGRSLSSLEKQDKHVSGTKKKQVDFAIRAKTKWGRV